METYCAQCFNWMNNFEFSSDDLVLSYAPHICTFCGEYKPKVIKIRSSGWKRYCASSPNRTEAYLRAHLPSAQPISGATLMGYYHNALRHWHAVQTHAAEQEERAWYGLAGSVARFDSDSRAKLADKLTETTEDKMDEPR